MRRRDGTEPQWLFDLMANERIKLVIEGEVGAVDAVLYLGNAFRPNEWDAVAFATEEDTLTDALEYLRDQYEAGVREDEKQRAALKQAGSK